MKRQIRLIRLVCTALALTLGATRKSPLVMAGDLADSPSPSAERKTKANELAEYLESYREGAEAGIPRDQYNLGASYRWGVEIPRDQALAVHWIRKAAENGYPLAQRTLADMFIKGEGLPQSDGEAMTWYKRAAGQGDSLAEKAVADLEAKIHPVDENNSRPRASPEVTK